MNSSVLFIFLIIWLLIAPIMKLSKQVKKQATKNTEAPQAAPQKQQKAPKAEAPQPAPVPQSEEGSFFRPTVMQPTITVTEHNDSIYQGSMSADTGEGYDPCHDEQLAPLSAAQAAEPVTEVAGPGLQLSWTGSDIVNGIVMSEILKRK
ncbi:MAG: hypothetical protein IJJ80_11890 [Clostridia bacterium]|nr:hypothetical protein [Clostridia bacterium]MBQ6288556.1 hypothetical protein [Clostridia bacterium]